jgi:phosphatidylinositol alpha-1,6-mannosyltransferase
VGAGDEGRSGGEAAGMRILLVTELYPPAVGGSAVLFEGIYTRLAGAEVTVLTDEHTSPASENGGVPPIPIVRRAIATRRWGVMDPKGLGHHLRVARQIRALARPIDAIVHCGRALPEGLAALFARRLFGQRYMVWCHGEELATAATSRELTFLARRIYRGAIGVFANSRNTASCVERFAGIAPERIHVVHPGVDPSRFHPGVAGDAVRRRLAPGGEALLLSVGRLQKRKGHDLAIHAVAALAKEGLALRYAIVGDRWERQALEALARELGVAHRIAFLGEVPAADLPAYYAAADIFLLPNRVEEGDFEGFGIVFLEAAAAGKPAIGGRSGGVAEAIEDGVTGLLVGGTDVDELAAAIRQLAASPALRARMGEAGRARVLREFTWERAAGRVGDILVRLGPRAERALGAPS